MRKPLLVLMAAATLAPAADNTLTFAEKKAGFRLLFDGKTMRGWRDPAKMDQPGDAWEISEGCLKTRLKPRIAEDLLSEDTFADYELLFDWKLSPRGNTGVKYHIQDTIFLDNTKIQRGPHGWEGIVGRELATRPSNRKTLAPQATGQVYTVGFEMQLLDDERHPDAKRDTSHTTGALYAMIPATAKAARPAGEWNTGKIVLRGSHFEHWINGTLVLSGSLDDPLVRKGAAERWGPAPAVRKALSEPRLRGPICLQHHGDEVWFKSIKIRVTN